MRTQVANSLPPPASRLIRPVPWLLRRWRLPFITDNFEYLCGHGYTRLLALSRQELAQWDLMPARPRLRLNDLVRPIPQSVLGCRTRMRRRLWGFQGRGDWENGKNFERHFFATTRKRVFCCETAISRALFGHGGGGDGQFFSPTHTHAISFSHYEFCPNLRLQLFILPK